MSTSANPCLARISASARTGTAATLASAPKAGRARLARKTLMNALQMVILAKTGLTVSTSTTRTNVNVITIFKARTVSLRGCTACRALVKIWPTATTRRGNGLVTACLDTRDWIAVSM